MRLTYATDEDLLDAIKRNDKIAFEFLFKKFYPRLFNYAIRFIQNNEAAEDILQECFLKIWEKRQHLLYMSLASLLFTRVRNSCLNYLKHRTLIQKLPIEYIGSLNGEERLYSTDLLLNADENLLYEDLKIQINQALLQLTPRSREIFLLSRFNKMTNRAIAEKLGISTTSLEKHISKSLKLISKYLRDNASNDIYIIIMSFCFFD